MAVTAVQACALEEEGNMVAIQQQHSNKNGRTSRLNCSIAKIFIAVLILASVLLWVSILLAVRLEGHSDNTNNRVRQQEVIELEKPPEFIRSSSLHTNEQQKHPSSLVQSPLLNAVDDVLSKWIVKQRSINNNGGTTAADNLQSSSTPSLSNLLSTPLKFTPGSLPLTQLSTLQHCHVHPEIYKHHLKGGPGQLSYSKKYNLSYILIPKSGSSTGRYMMKTEFDAVEPRGHKAIKEAMKADNIIAFVREPLSRFYSQYDEAYVRTAPWHNSQNPYYIDSNNPQQQTRKVHPFPFLYENFQSYHDYEDVFCPPSTRKNPNNRRECLYRPTQEDGTLAKRLDRFVQEYDGRTPYDVHLILQVPKLLSKNSDGTSIKVTELYNTTNSEHDWQLIAKKHIGQHAQFTKTEDAKQSGGVIEGRSFPRRFDKSLVEKETERRICLLALLDYCCLNFPLPSSCVGEGEEVLSCTMDYDDESGQVRVQPSVFPDVAQQDTVQS
jgi:hypothetical protein